MPEVGGIRRQSGPSLSGALFPPFPQATFHTRLSNQGGSGNRKTTMEGRLGLEGGDGGVVL